MTGFPQIWSITTEAYYYTPCMKSFASAWGKTVFPRTCMIPKYSTFTGTKDDCWEQWMLMYTAFIDLQRHSIQSAEILISDPTKDLVPPKLHNLIRLYHEDMKVTIQYDGNTSESFSIYSSVQQGCILAQLFSWSPPSFWGMHMGHQLKASISTLEQMAYCSTWPASDQKPKYARPSSGTCSLLVISILQDILSNNSRAWWTAPKHAKSLVSLSAWKNLMYLNRMLKHNPTSQLTAMSWRLSTNSHDWDPQ